MSLLRLAWSIAELAEGHHPCISTSLTKGVIVELLELEPWQLLPLFQKKELRPQFGDDNVAGGSLKLESNPVGLVLPAQLRQ